ncbi:hypothetical protein VKS41_004379 [Umbelopsis sp. WA50703]
MWKPTGTNDIPLGAKRRFGDSPDGSLSPKANGTGTSVSPTTERGRDPSPKVTTGSTNSEERQRKRRSRWGATDTKINIPGLPTAISSSMTKEQREQYSVHLRIEEINRKLRTGDVIPNERDRSPSPEPIYNADGKRVNTRDARYRKKYEDERQKIIEDAIRKYPDFRPPADYRKVAKTTEKVWIPAKEFPEINFIGLLIGPRGNTLKKMESESGAKISIRGKGSVKEGKSRTDAAANANQEEDLHCLVTADSEEKIKIAVKLIEKVIETSASVPEGQNELKRSQLRELAALNGTLRDDENQTCTNCGGVGHRRYECPEQQNVTNNLTCRICGGHGHMARDCLQRNNPEFMQQAQEREQQLDSEYMNLMAELGEKVNDGDAAAKTERPPWADRAAATVAAGGQQAPWQRGGSTGGTTGGSNPWDKNGVSSNGDAPWARNNSYAAPHGAQHYGGHQGYGGAPQSAYGAPQGGYYGSNGYSGYSGYGGYQGYDQGYNQGYDQGYDQSQPPPPPPSGDAPWSQQAPPPPSSQYGAPQPPPPPSEPAPPPPPSADTPPPPPPPAQ